MIFQVSGYKPTFVGNDHFLADSAQIIGAVELHDRTNIWFNAVLRGDKNHLIVGAGTNIQDSAVLHTDKDLALRIGVNCTIGHRVVLHGCSIGDTTLIGMGSVVMNNAKVGSCCLVGAGAVIPQGKEIPDGVLVLGNPAKIIREITPQEHSYLLESAKQYVQNARVYRATYGRL